MRCFGLMAPLIASAVLALAGCGQSNTTPSAPNVILHVESDGDFLMFKPERLNVITGTHVTLTFPHGGKSIRQEPDWVLAMPGTMDALLMESDKAAEGSGGTEDTSFLKPNDPRIIAATKLIKKGETTSVEFTAPAPGDYPYFCSTSGHADTMRGTLHVTAR